ncbi:MAG: hypothetical protein ABSE95_11560 [Thermodesulfobacteriota bacterium]
MVRFDPYIPAGGQGEILIQLIPKKLDGNFERFFKVISNDPVNPEVEIRFYGHAPEFCTHAGCDHF